MTKVRAIAHVQLAIPPNSESLARDFYVGVLGLVEIEKPHHLLSRGGCWFKLSDEITEQLHLGVEHDFRAARKAHVAFIVDNTRTVVASALSMGCEVVEDEMTGYDRAYIFDPFGNRLEIMQPLDL